MNTKKTIGIVGATGLIGSHLLEMLCESQEVISIHVLTRKPLNHKNNKIKEFQRDVFSLEVIYEALLGCDVVFCAIGTTQKNVKGDRNLYEKIDYQIPMDIAKSCEKLSIQQLHIVSAVGANANSNNFYINLKGRMEQDVSSCKIDGIFFYRPSLLLGQRNEFRLGEWLAQKIMPIFNVVIPAKYKAISARDVAKSMFKQSLKNQNETLVLHFTEMQTINKL
jgi:uncharacterized protein YbjT (DUF2867 family)